MLLIAERYCKGAAWAACLSAVFICGHARAQDAAHAIADKFAADAKADNGQAEQRKLLETMAKLKKLADEARANEQAERERTRALRQVRAVENRNSYGEDMLKQARQEAEAASNGGAETAPNSAATAVKIADDDAQRRAKDEAEAKAQAEKARARAQAEKEARIAREKAEREAKLAAKAEAARKARAQAAKDEAAKAARLAEEAERRRAKEVAEAKARAEAQAKAKAEAEARIAREKAEREAKLAARAKAEEDARLAREKAARDRAAAQRLAEEQSRKAYEQDLLKRAHDEAEAIRKARQLAAKEEAAKAAKIAETARRAEEKKVAKARMEAEARSRAEAQAKARAEREAQLAREKAEREAKLAAAADAVERAEQRAERAAADRAAEEAARLAAKATAREAEAEMAARDARQTSRRDREARELVARLREARDKRSGLGAPMSRPGPAVETRVTAIPPEIKPKKQSRRVPEPDERRVTVLLIMDVGDTGWRRISSTADPMLCLHQHCYLSRGVHSPAERLTRRAAFGPAVALGKRGGACRSSPACIFRGIDLETAEAVLQPVDLRFLRHDRRETRLIRADKTCSVANGELVCGHTVRGADWQAWIVPESVAKRAGAEALELALDAGLETLD